MDIRIGNDIRIDAPFSIFGVKDANDIRNVECLLVKTTGKIVQYKQIIGNDEHYVEGDSLVIDEVMSSNGIQHYVSGDELIIKKDLLDSDSEHYVKGDSLIINDNKTSNCEKKQFCNHSAYTISNHFTPTYNVYPYNAMSKYFFTAPQRYGTCCNNKKENTISKEYIRANIYISDKDQVVYMYFPSELQKCGTYELIVKLVTNDNERIQGVPKTRTFDYGKVFKLVEDSFGECGNVVIALPKYNNFSNNISISSNNNSNDSENNDNDQNCNHCCDDCGPILEEQTLIFK